MNLDFEKTLEVQTRTVKDLFVTVDGRRLNVEHTLDLLDEVGSGQTVVTDHELGDHFIKLGILKGRGSHRWMTPASEGEHFDAFRKVLVDLMEKHG
jgi:pectin methylesterase-like acyl-CoA thioesterase